MSASVDHGGFPFEAVVLVADMLEDTTIAPETHLRRDLEKTTAKVLADISDAIRSLGLTAYHYRDPAVLATAAPKHRGDIVLSVYGGQSSRSRMALVPAICETFQLPCVGPDAYGRVICQDKEISKRLAREAGLTTPEYLLARDETDLDAIADFPLPFVAKPVLEGSSIGIGPDNLVRSSDEGLKVVRQLLSEFSTPIMVESFVAGMETNVSLIETQAQIELRVSESYVPDVPSYFDSHLFDAGDKLRTDSPIRNRALPLNVLSKADRDAILCLVKLIGGIGYGRVDGKFSGGRFHFLEITPDAWLGKTGAFVSGFVQNGWSYEDVIRSILLSRRV
jgi:D-alanine-D-alanine ligase